MALWVCDACDAKFAVDTVSCPQCGSVKHHEEGAPPPPKPKPASAAKPKP